jgi:two-component system chemotaxis response regulator CheY
VDGMKKRVLSVGQCGMDHGSIAWMMQKHFGAEVVGADTKAEALAEARADELALVLVNRLMDRDGSPGLDIIRAFKADNALKHLPIMLVSNYDDAQREAVSLGAMPGFGKSALGQPQTLARIEAALLTAQRNDEQVEHDRPGRVGQFTHFQSAFEQEHNRDDHGLRHGPRGGQPRGHPGAAEGTNQITE